MARTLGKRDLFASLVGLAAGAAAAGGTYLVRRRFARGGPDRINEQLELAVVDALCADEVAGSCAIDVAAVGPGIIELSGTVPDEGTSERVAEVAQGVDGVHTIVNRLVVEMLERHLEENRRKRASGAPALQARGWEGMGSGMGRRQGATEPPRRDDSAELKEEAIGMDGRTT